MQTHKEKLKDFLQLIKAMREAQNSNNGNRAQNLEHLVDLQLPIMNEMLIVNKPVIEK